MRWIPLTQTFAHLRPGGSWSNIDYEEFVVSYLCFRMAIQSVQQIWSLIFVHKLGKQSESSFLSELWAMISAKTVIVGETVRNRSMSFHSLYQSKVIGFKLAVMQCSNIV